MREELLLEERLLELLLLRLLFPELRTLEDGLLLLLSVSTFVRRVELVLLFLVLVFSTLVWVLSLLGLRELLSVLTLRRVLLFDLLSTREEEFTFSLLVFELLVRLVEVLYPSGRLLELGFIVIVPKSERRVV